MAILPRAFLVAALGLAACSKSPTPDSPPSSQGSGGQPTDTTAAQPAASDASNTATATTTADSGTTPQGDSGTMAASDAGGSVTAEATDAATDASTASDGAAPAGDLAAAEAIYNRACGRCHPHGNAGDGPRVRGRRWAEARMRTQIRQGGGDMPAIRPTRLSDPDLATMMAFLRSIQAVR